MKKLIVLSIVFLAAHLSFAADDYVLTINGTSHDLGLDSSKEIILPSGERIEVGLKMKDQIQYDRPFFSFKHSNKYRPSSSDLGDGIFQTMLAMPDGTVILLQEYTNMDPSSMIDLMLNELTKEEVDYGYTYEEAAVSKEIGKRKVTGKRAVTSYKDDNWVREVYTIAGKDCGVLIVTMIETTGNAKDQQNIDTFWKTLQIANME